jgi:hypothetical protein
MCSGQNQWKPHHTPGGSARSSRCFVSCAARSSAAVHRSCRRDARRRARMWVWESVWRIACVASRVARRVRAAAALDARDGVRRVRQRACARGGSVRTCASRRYFCCVAGLDRRALLPPSLPGGWAAYCELRRASLSPALPALPSVDLPGSSPGAESRGVGLASTRLRCPGPPWSAARAAARMLAGAGASATEEEAAGGAGGGDDGGGDRGVGCCDETAG